jgi:glycosyltransferase involved in cell wall biosynthesis
VTAGAVRVSVVMATYNHAEFVREAIESVLSQEGVEFEFLIADDGSADDTPAIVAAAKDPRISFFPHSVNRGAGIVTNELISHSRGEFVAIINSDDAWRPEKLRYQVDVLDEDQSIGATFGRVTFVDRQGRPIPKGTLPFGEVFDQENRSSGRWLRTFFDAGNCLCHPTMLIRRSCYDELGLYSNRLRQLPDFDMWVRLARRYELRVSERDLLRFRILPGENASSQTGANSVRSINEHFLIAETFFDGVDRAHLVDGFGDLLVVADVPTERHLDIEKALLYFVPNQWLGRPYQLIGLQRMRRLLDSEAHRNILAESYDIDDRWFQREMGEVEVLRPKLMAGASNLKAQMHAKWRRMRALIPPSRP